MCDVYSNAIEERFGFKAPKEYHTLASKGLFKNDGPSVCTEFYEPGSYLWLNEMEWCSPVEIGSFEFQAYQLPGLVPFAITGGGDLWCWHPTMATEQGAPVLCCYHDDEMADVYAPNFFTALFRQALDFCMASEDDTSIDASAFLHRWAIDLSGVLPAPWCARLTDLANSKNRAELAEAIDDSEVSFPNKGTRVRWMHFR